MAVLVVHASGNATTSVCSDAMCSCRAIAVPNNVVYGLQYFCRSRAACAQNVGDLTHCNKALFPA